MLWYCDPLTPVYKTKKKEFCITGEGFKWSHYTMTSMEANDHIYDLFRRISPDDSIYMPQYSFDFWIIPYLLGKGISLDRFRTFMYGAHQALSLEIGEPDHTAMVLGREKIFRDLRREFQRCSADPLPSTSKSKNAI
jgi:hypothetical protein